MGMSEAWKRRSLAHHDEYVEVGQCLSQIRFTAQVLMDDLQLRVTG